MASGGGESGFELAGEVVCLRDLRPSDEESFIRWASFPEMYTYMQWRLDGPEAAQREFRRLLGHPARLASPRTHWYLAVVNDEGHFAGITGFEHLPDGRAELGWYLSPPYWNRGYATAATGLILDFLCEDLGVAEVTATCDPDNAASRRVLQKAGLQVTGEEMVDTWRGPRARLRMTLRRGLGERTRP